MKRIKQLQPLSKEHHQSLVLSQKAIKTAAAGDQKAISRLCNEIVDSYSDTWKVHFKIEEESIFQLFENINTEITQLCDALKQEHQMMNAYYEKMKAGDVSVLGEFGALLKQHTRTEERELFPMLEEELTNDALKRIEQISREYRKIRIK